MPISFPWDLQEPDPRYTGERNSKHARRICNQCGSSVSRALYFRYKHNTGACIARKENKARPSGTLPQNLGDWRLGSTHSTAGIAEGMCETSIVLHRVYKFLI